MKTDSPEFNLPDSLKNYVPKIGIVLGSGLSTVAEAIKVKVECSYSDIENLPTSKVPGHSGKFLCGSLSGVEIIVAQGRVHLYEGWSAREVTAQIRVMAQMGAETIVLTNAAGIVNANFSPGQWMLISDHLNLTRQSPLTGSANFIDQSSVYSPELRDLLKEENKVVNQTRLAEGVYAWINGPEYETPAEIRMLRNLGADAVGMSTVPEAIQARALGLRVVALSCLSNYGSGLSPQPLSHDEVIETGKNAALELCRLLGTCVPAMVEI